MAHLLRLSLPMFVAMFAIISYQLADAYFVAKLGTEALAALTFTFPVTMVIMNIMFGYSIAMTSIIARKFGQEHSEDDIQRKVTDGLILGCIVMVALVLITATFHEQIFRLLGAQDSLLPMIADYMYTWYWGAVFIALPIVGNAAMRAGGDTIFPAILMIAFAVINVILDPIFIFGYFGFPALGIQGAALATVVGNFVTLVLMLWAMHFRDKMISWRLPHWPDFFRSVKQFNEIGVPAGIMNLINPVFTGAVTALIAPFGAAAVAAYGVVGRVEIFAFTFWIALAIGLVPLVGQNFGRYKYERVEDSIRAAIKLCAIAGIIWAVLLIVFAQPIIAFFDADPDVVDVGALYLTIVPVSYIFYGILRVYAAAFNGIGMARRALYLTILQAFVLGIPVIALGSYFFEIRGLFTGVAISYGVSGLLAYLWYNFYQKITPLMKRATKKGA